MFIQRSDGHVNICRETFTDSLFQEMEPNYSKDGVRYRLYDPKEGVHKIIDDASNESKGEIPWREGDRYINRIGEYIFYRRQKNSIKEIETPHDSTGEEKMPTTHELVAALWAHIVDKKHEVDTIFPLKDRIKKMKGL